MSSGLTHIGAIARGLAYAPVLAARVPGQGDEAVKRAAPGDAAAAAERKVRDEVMAERGIDPQSLYALGAQERLRAETAMRVETSLRMLTARNQQRAAGSVLDIRV